MAVVSKDRQIEQRLAKIESKVEARRKGKEVTTVTGWDERGRITTFEKTIEEPAADEHENHSKELAPIHAKLDRGESLTKDERAVLSAHLCIDIQQRIRGAMEDERAEHVNPVMFTQGAHNSIALAVDLLVQEMMLISAAHSEKREQVRAEVKAHIGGEVRTLIKFIEGQAKTINALNQKVAEIESSLGLSKTLSRRRA